MLIVGTKGSAKDLTVVLEANEDTRDLVFFDDVSTSPPSNLFDCYPVLTTIEAAKSFFKDRDNRFCVAVGNPRMRKKVAARMMDLGGSWAAVRSNDLTFGAHSQAEKGIILLPGVRISNHVEIGEGCFFGVNSIVGHDGKIGEYCTISPGATLLGNVTVGPGCYIGANATLLPGVTLGKNVIVGAGTVVEKDVEDFQSFVGPRNSTQ